MSKIYPYAGFWKRAVALLIDSIVISIPLMLISSLLVGSQVASFVNLAAQSAEPDPAVFFSMMSKWMLSCVLLNVISLIVMWLYHALMESSKHQATLGKMALGIKVVGANGERISFARATGRTFAKFLSYIPLYFGAYMAGFTKQRQALHDLIATTYVVDKNYQQGQELPILPFSKGGLIAGILVAIAPIVFYIGIIALAMTMAIASGGISNELQDTKGAFTDMQQMGELSNELANLQRDSLIIHADLELNELAEKHKILREPLTKDGVVYSQDLAGYHAAITDKQGNHYELLLRPGEFTSCCAKGPNGSCGDDSLYEPCDK